MRSKEISSNQNHRDSPPPLIRIETDGLVECSLLNKIREILLNRNVLVVVVVMRSNRLSIRSKKPQLNRSDSKARRKIDPPMLFWFAYLQVSLETNFKETIENINYNVILIDRLREKKKRRECEVEARGRFIILFENDLCKSDWRLLWVRIYLTKGEVKASEIFFRDILLIYRWKFYLFFLQIVNIIIRKNVRVICKNM